MKSKFKVGDVVSFLVGNKKYIGKIIFIDDKNIDTLYHVYLVESFTKLDDDIMWYPFGIDNFFHYMIKKGILKKGYNYWPVNNTIELYKPILKKFIEEMEKESK